MLSSVYTFLSAPVDVYYLYGTFVIVTGSEDKLPAVFDPGRQCLPCYFRQVRVQDLLW